MPAFVEDTDVLQQIAVNDAEASSIAIQIQTIAPTSAGLQGWSDSVAGWNADLSAWRAWSSAAKARLSGGFWGGEWFGVVADGNAAINWKNQLDAWQAVFNFYARGSSPPVAVPTPGNLAAVSDTNAGNTIGSIVKPVGDAAKGLTGPLAALAVLGVAVAVIFVVVELRGKA